MRLYSLLKNIMEDIFLNALLLSVPFLPRRIFIIGAQSRQEIGYVYIYTIESINKLMLHSEMNT